MTHAIDPTSDRLFRHMAWANARLFAVLHEMPETVFTYREPGNDWSVGMIVAHLAEAATSYASRLDDQPYADLPFDAVSTYAELAIAAAACAGADGRLHQAAHTPAGVVVRRDNPALTRARATVLGQSIHHATEHRAQIAGALIANGVTALNLDDLDMWAFGDAEGLGA
ncbi:MAG: DinB family protein [Roseiflexaceae bacterium]